MRQPRRGVAAIMCASAITGVLAGHAGAAELQPIHFEPVTKAGGVYNAATGGWLATKYPKGYDTGADKAENAWATATLPEGYAWKDPEPWTSVGATNGSFIQNQTGKPICEFTITARNGDTFSADSTAGNKWKVTLNANKTQMKITAIKQPDDCITQGAWFWMRVQRITDDKVLEGKLGLAPLDAAADGTAVALGPAPADDVTSGGVAGSALVAGPRA